MKRLKLSLGGLIPLLTVLAGVLLYQLDPLALQVLRNTTFDQYQRWDARPYRDAPVRVIDIDNESLARLGQWPWPRTRIAELVDRLNQAGASAIVFDVVFAEPDRTSPAAMLDTWKTAAPGLRRQLAQLPDHDTLLVRALSRGNTVLGHAPREDDAGPSRFSIPYNVVDMGPPALPFLHGFPSTVTALPAFQEAAAGNGAIAFVPDSDGVLRRVPLLLRVGDQVVATLAGEALRVSQQASDYVVITSEEAGAGIEEILIGHHSLSTTAEGEMWVRFTTAGQARYIPAWKVLAGQVEESALKGNIVLIGTSAKGLLDLRFGPLGSLPGVEVHALALEQILAGTPLIRPNWATGLEVTAIVVGGLLVGLVALHSGALVSAALVTLLLAGTAAGGWYAYAQHALLLDLSTPGLIFLLAFLLSSLHHHIVSERRQRWIREAFARYVSPNRVAHLVDHPGELELGGQRRECSFIFTDLAGFTSLMEKLDPNQAVALLNVYLDNMIGIAFQHEGTLDRIVGDAVAIMFSAPVIQADHRQRALACAAAMHEFASRYAAEAQARGTPFGATRIGIHTGEVTVGNFGGTTIFDYRALGDPVNTASRLESVNKQLGTLVCVSQPTLSGCPDVAARPVGKLVLKGKTEPLMVHEPRFAARTQVPDPDTAYLQAYTLMEQGDPAAQAAFAQLDAERGDDPLVKFHLNRLTTGQTGDIIVFSSK